MARVHRAKLFVFLRQQRHLLFSDEFQQELATALYDDKRASAHPARPTRAGDDPASLYRRLG